MNYEELKGQTLTRALHRELQDRWPNHRIMEPGYGYTCDYDPGRLWIAIDKYSVIIDVGFG